MKRRAKTLVKGIMGGVCNSIGGWLYLRARVDLGSIVVASFLFTTGSVFIAHWFFYLFTGKIGFLLEKDDEKRRSKAIDLGIGLLGNLLGCMMMGFLIRTAAYDTNVNLFHELQGIVNMKIGHDWYEALMLLFALNITCTKIQKDWYSVCLVTKFIKENIDVFRDFFNENNREGYRPMDYENADDDTQDDGKE